MKRLRYPEPPSSPRPPSACPVNGLVERAVRQEYRSGRGEGGADWRSLVSVWPGGRGVGGPLELSFSSGGWREGGLQLVALVSQALLRSDAPTSRASRAGRIQDTRAAPPSIHPSIRCIPSPAPEERAPQHPDQ